VTAVFAIAVAPVAVADSAGRKEAAKTKVSERTCVACRAKAPRAELLRFVRGADGRLIFDQSGRLPGRGAWTCSAIECFEGAIVRGRFAHIIRLSGSGSALDTEMIDELRASVEAYLNVAK